MKNKIFLGVLFMLLSFMNVSAASVSLSCSETTLVKGSTTSCTLYGNSNHGVSGVSGILSTSGGVSISSITKNSIWQGDGNDGNIILYTDEDVSGSFGIVNFTVKFNGEGNITINNVVFSINEQDNNVSGSSVVLKEKEEIVNKPSDSVINNESNTSNNTNNNTNSNTNNNSNNNINNDIPKEEKKSSDCSLKSLTLSNGNIDFSSDVTDYVVEVSNDVESIEISALVNDSKASINYPNNLLLNVGDNKFSVLVIAEDGSKKNYNVNVVRLEKVLSSNSSLISLNIDGYDIDFSSDKFTYDIGNIIGSTLKIDAKSFDSNASVKIYGNDYIGKNDVVVVQVTAEDGSISNYTLFANNTSLNSSSVIIIFLIISFMLNIFLLFKEKNSLFKKKI